MAFSKITKIILYVVAGISLLVVLFFYLAPNLVSDFDALDDRVTEAQNAIDLSPVIQEPVIDTVATDSTSGELDSTVVASAPAPVEPPPVMEPKSAKEVLSGWEYIVWKRTDVLLVWAYVLAMLALLAAVIFPIIAMIQNPKRLVGLAIVLVGAAVMVVFAYIMSSDTALDIIGYNGTANSDAATLKMVDTLLFVTYMLSGLAVGSILYAIVSKALK